ATRSIGCSRWTPMPRSTSCRGCSRSTRSRRTRPRALRRSPRSVRPCGRGGRSMPAPPEVRYARSGDLSIAWFEHGEGPLDIVYVPGFISNADLVWEMPVYRYAIERMATFGRVITFDKRGTGLSDRSLGHGSVAERMDDIRAVMDAAGCERAALVGISEGGPL